MKGLMEPVVRQAIFPLWVRRSGHADYEVLGEVHHSHFLSKFETGALGFKDYLHCFVMRMEDIVAAISTVRSAQDLISWCDRKAGFNGGSGRKRWVCTKALD